MLDITTSLFSMMFVELAMTVILAGFLFSQSHSSTPGLREMTAANAMACIAALFGSYGSSTNDLTFVWPAIVVFFACVLTAARAMRRLQSKKPLIVLESVTLTISGFATYWFIMEENDLSLAVSINSVMYVMVCAITAYDLLLEREPSLNKSCRFLAWTFIVFGLLQAFRAVTRPFQGMPGTIKEQVVLIDHLSAYVGMSVSIAWSLGLLWASYRRTAFKLRHANQNLERFAHASAHDLKSPLSAVIGYLDAYKTIGAKLPEHERDAFIGNAREAAWRMDEFIDELLTSCVMDKKEDNLTQVNAKQCAQRACRNLIGKIDNSGADIEIPDLPFVKANAVQLTRVFQNLLENALKFRAEERTPEIRISAITKSDLSVFYFTDNGRGISETNIARIFSDFTDSHSSCDESGYGIGLGECKTIIESFGGYIDVSSELGIGTTFTFAIPRAEHSAS